MLTYLTFVSQHMERCCGFMDDTLILARGKTLDKSNQVRYMMEKSQGGLDWSSHTSATLQLISLESWDSRRWRERKIQAAGHVQDPLTRKLIYLQGTKIPSGQLAQVPRSNIRSRTAVKEMVDYALQRGTNGWNSTGDWQSHRGVYQLSTCGSSIWPLQCRRCYIAADLFPIPESPISKGMKGYISRLGRIQRQASLHITGAMRSTPTDVADECTDLLPFTC